MKTCFLFDVSDMLLFGIRNDGPAAAAQPRLDGGRDVTRGGVTPKATTKMTTFLRDPQGLKAKSNETLPMAAVRRPMSANAEGRSRYAPDERSEVRRIPAELGGRRGAATDG